MRKSHFTLVEIAVVLGIMLLFTGIVVLRISQTTRTISADKLSGSIQKLFSTASFAAQTKGETVEIIFDSEQRCLRINMPVGTTFSPDELSSEFIPKELEIQFSEFKGAFLDETSPVFKFYPDGTASGLPFSVKGRNFTLNFMVSNLTGNLIVAASTY